MTQPGAAPQPLGMSDFFALEAGGDRDRRGWLLPRPPGPPAGGLVAGARAFVAREGAAIASALDRAGRTLRANPMAHDPLQHVLKALQPLRGLAALNDLPPLPDLLEGIEQSISELNRTSGAPPAG